MKFKQYKTKKLAKNAAKKVLAGDASAAAAAASEAAAAKSNLLVDKEHKKHPPEASTVAVENLEKNKIRRHKVKQEKKKINDKVTVEPGALKKRNLAKIKPTSRDSYKEQKISDVQRYLERMHLTEIGQYMDKLKTQTNIYVSRFSIFID